MIESDRPNIEKGLAEISRKHNLTIASLGLALPYGLLIVAPTYYFCMKNGIPWIVPWIPYIIFHVWLHFWFSKSLCPQCGQEVGHAPWGPYNWECKSCKLLIESPKWFGNKISFKKIHYIPGRTDK